jgi:hypothetical protein
MIPGSLLLAAPLLLRRLRQHTRNAYSRFVRCRTQGPVAAFAGGSVANSCIRRIMRMLLL